MSGASEKSGKTSSSPHRLRPFIPEKLGESDARYPARDIFEDGLHESAGGYIETRHCAPEELVPVITEPGGSGGEADITEPEEDEEPPPPPPSFSEEDLETAKKDAYEQGKAAGEQLALEASAREREEQAAAVKALSDKLREAERLLRERRAALEPEYAGLFVRALRRFFNDINGNDDARAAMLCNALNEELAAMKRCGEEKYVIELHEKDAAFVTQTLFSGDDNGLIRVNADITPGEAKIIRENGATFITPAAIIQVLEQA